MCDVSFLPAWKSATVSSDKYGASNYVLRINATDGDMGAFYATEPFAGAAQIYWEVLGIRFHYPSEHTIDGVRFDLEMQVTLNDTKKLCQWCTSHLGAFSLFFNVDTTESTDFWAWTDQMTAGQNLTIDLSKVFDKNKAIQSQMWGYQGSDTEPNCTLKFCWYFNYPPQTITQETLDKLKVDGVEANYRDMNLGGRPIYRY